MPKGCSCGPQIRSSEKTSWRLVCSTLYQNRLHFSSFSAWLTLDQWNFLAALTSLTEGPSSMFPQHLVLVLWHHSSPLSIYSLVFHTPLRFPWRKRLSLSSVPSNIPGTWQMLRKENSFSLQPKTSLPKVKVPSPPAHTGTKHFWDYKRLPELSWDTERTVIEEDTIIF